MFLVYRMPDYEAGNPLSLVGINSPENKAQFVKAVKFYHPLPWPPR